MTTTAVTLVALKPFVSNLLAVLADPASRGVIYWTEAGDAVAITNQAQALLVLRKYFRIGTIASFYRHACNYLFSTRRVDGIMCLAHNQGLFHRDHLADCYKIQSREALGLVVRKAKRDRDMKRKRAVAVAVAAIEAAENTAVESQPTADVAIGDDWVPNQQPRIGAVRDIEPEDNDLHAEVAPEVQVSRSQKRARLLQIKLSAKELQLEQLRKVLDNSQKHIERLEEIVRQHQPQTDLFSSY
jgi:hypothetical protein